MEMVKREYCPAATELVLKRTPANCYYLYAGFILVDHNKIQALSRSFYNKIQALSRTFSRNKFYFSRNTRDQ